MLRITSVFAVFTLAVLLTTPLPAQDADLIDSQPLDVQLPNIEVLDGNQFIDLGVEHMYFPVRDLDESLILTYLEPVELALEFDSADPGRLMVKINGRLVPEERLVRKANELLLLDPRGQTVARLELIDAEGLLHIHEPDIPPQPVIGVRVLPVGETLAAQLGLAKDHGVVICDVTEAYPAAQAGVQKHDVVTHLNGEPITGTEGFQKSIQTRTPGTAIRLQIVRGGKSIPIDVVVGDHATLAGNNALTTTWLEPGSFVLGGPAHWESRAILEEIAQGNGAAAGEIPFVHFALPQVRTRVLPPVDPNAALKQRIDSLQTQVEELKLLIQELLESRAKTPSTPR